MYCLNIPSQDPFFNLALEEYLLKSRKENFMVLYVNSPSVIIGKHQVANRETDIQFVNDNKIPVIRRISGGGTVYHDEGNLNFSFITQSTGGNQIDFKKYTLPVIKFLSVLGVEARFEGKNDLKVNGLKISGNSEHVFGNRVLHHGTILYDTNLDLLRKSIRKDTSKYLTRAVKSNPSPVVNLKGMIPDVKDINVLRSQMVLFFIDENGYKLIDLSPDEKKGIALLAGSKYNNWEWNYAYGPEYHFINQFEIGEIKCSCSIFVKNGVIEKCDLTGSEDIRLLEKILTGKKHLYEELKGLPGIENIFSWIF